MLKLTVQDLEQDRVVTRFGSDSDLLDFLKLHYPVTERAPTLTQALALLNDSDLYRALVKPYEPDPASNLLPDDYLHHSQADEEDPWPRAGDSEF